VKKIEARAKVNINNVTPVDTRSVRAGQVTRAVLRAAFRDMEWPQPCHSRLLPTALKLHYSAVLRSE